MGKKRKPTMVLVRWRDASMTCAAHWMDGLPAAPKSSDFVCVSVGWLTHKSKHFVQLTQTLTTGQHAHVIDIPAGMVMSITPLQLDPGAQ